MKKKISVIIILIIVLVIAILWINGTIPKQIARIAATHYIEKNFPKMQVKYEGIEWEDSFGSYGIIFKDENGELCGFSIGPKYFPITPGQGIQGFMERYNMKYGEHQVEGQQLENNKKYIELENVPIDYSLAQMIEDKYYIEMNSNAVYNITELDNFIKNVENGIPDEIRIAKYTIEGQPVLTNLEYTSNKFILKTDSRRDGYAATEDKKVKTKEYDASEYKLIKGSTPTNKTDIRTEYSVELKSINTNEEIPICSYVEINSIQ